MNDIVLQLENLTKEFGTLRAVDDVSLSVQRGEIVGFLGPNGAGKTTTIGMALGLIHPTAGQIEVLGETVTPAATSALRRVGALAGASAALVPYLSGRDNLKVTAQMHPGVPRNRVDEVLALVDLEHAADRPASTYSTGMKQRLGLGMALLHKPELLILDEPTNGMDPAGMREVRNLLRELAASGTSIFLSSHLLHEVEQVCDRVAVLNRGRVVAQGAVDELIGGQTVVKVRVPDTMAAARALATLPGVGEVEANGIYTTVTGARGDAIVEHLVGAGIVPSEVTPIRVDLEHIYLELTEEAA